MIKVLLHEDYKFALFVPDNIDMWDKDGADDFIFPVSDTPNREIILCKLAFSSVGDYNSNE